MAKKKSNLPASLRKTVLFENNKMSNKDKIDLLINERGFTTKEILARNRKNVKNAPAYRLSNGGKSVHTFKNLAETKYIDSILKLGGHVADTQQNLKKGAIAEGPSHENNGIKVQINEQTVAEIEGGEIVINTAASELHCEELSKINQSAGNGVAFDCGCTMKRGGHTPLSYTATDHTETQSLLFDKEKYSIDSAQDWIYRHNYKNATEVDETEHKYRFRQQDPQKFFAKGFRTITLTDGIQAIIGHPIKKAELGAQTCGCHHAANDSVIAAKGATIKKPTILQGHQAQYDINKEIEALIDSKGENPENYSSDEKNSLRMYSDYGGLVTEDITLEQAKQSFTEFYTPDLIVQKMWALAYKHGFRDGQSVLEPSVGTGQFLKYVPVESEATGYEINKSSYTICKILYPKFRFFLRPFEEIFIKNRDSIKGKIDDLPKYDLVTGNPPYGDVGGYGMGMGEKSYTKAGNWIEYFLLRGLDLTKPGGLLIYIIGTEVANGGIPFLQQGPSKTKEMIAERADLIDAYRLPNGVFERTDALTDILVFKHK